MELNDNDLDLYKPIEYVVSFSPHPDDSELGCGGMLHSLKQQGADITVIGFSWCEEERLKDEFKQAMEELEVDYFDLYDYDRRYFQRDRQKILDAMIKLTKYRNFDLVLTPSRVDVHQDHFTVTREAIRAFRTSATILGYELPRNNLNFPADYFYILTEENLAAKKRSLACYRSQSEKNRSYFEPEVSFFILLPVIYNREYELSCVICPEPC